MWPQAICVTTEQDAPKVYLYESKISYTQGLNISNFHTN